MMSKLRPQFTGSAPAPHAAHGLSTLRATRNYRARGRVRGAVDGWAFPPADEAYEGKSTNALKF